MCLLEPKHKHTVTCHGSNSNKQWGNSNGKNDSVEKEAKAKKKTNTHSTSNKQWERVLQFGLAGKKESESVLFGTLQDSKQYGIKYGWR